MKKKFIEFDEQMQNVINFLLQKASLGVSNELKQISEHINSKVVEHDIPEEKPEAPSA